MAAPTWHAPREIGQVRVTGYESKGRINKRIRIEVVDAGSMPRLESPAIDAVVARVRATLSDSHPQIAEIFEGCFRNSLDTSVTLEPDGTTFVATGDIRAMWLRDWAAQVRRTSLWRPRTRRSTPW